MFNKDALERDLPGRLSKLVELPVVKHNDLSIYYCRRCIGKRGEDKHRDEVSG